MNRLETSSKFAITSLVSSLFSFFLCGADASAHKRLGESFGLKQEGTQDVELIGGLVSALWDSFLRIDSGFLHGGRMIFAAFAVTMAACAYAKHMQYRFLWPLGLFSLCVATIVSLASLINF